MPRATSKTRGRRRQRRPAQPQAKLPSSQTAPAIDLCARLGVPAELPAPHSMVAITAGVMEGEAVEGVRYPPESHLSGWFLFAASYSGDSDVDDFQVVHAFHLFEDRPDLAAFLALPAGWRFDTRPGAYVHFDPVVARGGEAD